MNAGVGPRVSPLKDDASQRMMPFPRDFATPIYRPYATNDLYLVLYP